MSFLLLFGSLARCLNFFRLAFNLCAILAKFCDLPSRAFGISPVRERALSEVPGILADLDLKLSLFSRGFPGSCRCAKKFRQKSQKHVDVIWCWCMFSTERSRAWCPGSSTKGAKMKVVLKDESTCRAVLYRLVMNGEKLQKLEAVADVDFVDCGEDGEVIEEVEFSDAGVLLTYCDGFKTVEFLNVDEGFFLSRPAPVSGWYLESWRCWCEPRRINSLKDWVIAKALRYRVITDDEAFKSGIRFGRRVIRELPYRLEWTYAKFLAVYSLSADFEFSVDRIWPWRIEIRKNGKIVCLNPELNLTEVF
ncbi:MAG: hypothetical protein RML32_10310 [Gammaproteobacteria bacterium]|nr:hypothetical protein [Gammaproteobacteria bacterium]